MGAARVDLCKNGHTDDDTNCCLTGAQRGAFQRVSITTHLQLLNNQQLIDSQGQAEVQTQAGIQTVVRSDGILHKEQC